jgi:hypothetical protein
MKAKGTATTPVTLTTSLAGERWQGVTFGAHAGESSFSFVELSYTSGAAGLSVLTAPGHLTIRDSAFSNNATDVLVGCNARPTLSNDRYRSSKGLVNKTCP